MVLSAMHRIAGCPCGCRHPAPPSYCNLTRDCSLDQPLTPLLDDYDGGDSPIFMNAPQFQFPPLPTYSEVSVRYIRLVYTEHWISMENQSNFCSSIV